MKRTISLLLTVLMICASLFCVNSFAATPGEDMFEEMNNKQIADHIEAWLIAHHLG